MSEQVRVYHLILSNILSNINAACGEHSTPWHVLTLDPDKVTCLRCLAIASGKVAVCPSCKGDTKQLAFGCIRCTTCNGIGSCSPEAAEHHKKRQAEAWRIKPDPLAALQARVAALEARAFPPMVITYPNHNTLKPIPPEELARLKKSLAESQGEITVMPRESGKLIHCITCDIRFPGAESGLAHECPGCKGTIWRDMETWRRVGKHGVPVPHNDLDYARISDARALITKGDEMTPGDIPAWKCWDMAGKVDYWQARALVAEAPPVYGPSPLKTAYPAWRAGEDMRKAAIAEGQKLLADLTEWRTSPQLIQPAADTPIVAEGQR